MDEGGRSMTVADIATRRGISVTAARRWVARLVASGDLRAIGRDVETGAKLYAPDDVERAIRSMPGQGARTDRPRAPEDSPSCQDPPSP